MMNTLALDHAGYAKEKNRKAVMVLLAGNLRLHNKIEQNLQRTEDVKCIIFSDTLNTPTSEFLIPTSPFSLTPDNKQLLSQRNHQMDY